MTTHGLALIALTGSRLYPYRGRLEDTLLGVWHDALQDGHTGIRLIHGDADGADTIGDQWPAATASLSTPGRRTGPAHAHRSARPDTGAATGAASSTAPSLDTAATSSSSMPARCSSSRHTTTRAPGPRTASVALRQRGFPCGECRRERGQRSCGSGAR